MTFYALVCEKCGRLYSLTKPNRICDQPNCRGKLIMIKVWFPDDKINQVPQYLP